MKSVLSRSIKDLQALLPRMEPLAPQLGRLGDALLDCWKKNGKVLIAGNGGSAADAMHLAEELCVRFAKNRRALAAMALCDPTVLTCAANDFGFESIFSRQIESLVSQQDVLVALTTSGNSLNMIRGVEAGRAHGTYLVGFTGETGGQLAGKVDLLLNIPSNDAQRIQECHITIGHIACGLIEKLACG